MRCFRYSLFIPLFICCASEYKSLQPATLDKVCIEKIRPRGLNTSWYTASVDVMGRHLSGLVLVKNQPDSSTRVVFTNEAGITFFDFEFDKRGAFAVKRVIPQLNKRPVIHTLRKDFELLLGIPFRHPLKAWASSNQERWYGTNQKNETAYFITQADCASLLRIELGSKRKRKTSLILKGENLMTPDSIRISHYTFNMQIELKKLVRD
jgi:hypothetical protein